ncbi:MAG: hypothetical protein HFJ58_02145 [Clostridia bacterium]|nr:hypothetical protein [Clostridia bacterium]
MNEIKGIFTPEQEDALRNLYLAVDGELHPLVEGNHPTKDNVTIIDLRQGMKIAYDFSWDGDDYFLYHCGEVGECGYLCRESMPKEVAEILDAMIEETENC